MKKFVGETALQEVIKQSKNAFAPKSHAHSQYLTNTDVTAITGTPDTGKTLQSEIDAVEASLASLDTNKQAVISDLATIRSNASTGAGLKTKVDGIASGAQVNVIETVKVNNTALPVTNKAVNIDISGKANLSGATFTGNITAPKVILESGIELF